MSIMGGMLLKVVIGIEKRFEIEFEKRLQNLQLNII
jgi:hypothetical protein